MLSKSPSSKGYDENGNAIVLADKCRNSFSFFGSYSTPNYGNPSDYMLDQIRQTVLHLGFCSRYYSEASAQQTIQKSLGQVVVDEYQVLWRWWAASLAVTYAIVIFILPTFYGFWTLARKTTLGPFETARAFHAPVVSDALKHLDTPALLKKVGRKNLHTDLVPYMPVSPVVRKERDN
ncbi:hypothetical protein B0J14DRAFT_146313 [Halenospora varia]|nr:hypothetical protein B0J14DRAFT_146313 [Halenospora varia]